MNSNTVSDIKKQLNSISDIYKYIKDENVIFDDSVLTIIGKKFHDENAISDYLAYVLDPELNGVGHQPLANFINQIDPSVELLETDKVDIKREYTLSNNRRIDFLITINDERIIAIEHKVFSGEHGDQTWDYEREINKLFQDKIDNIMYVFLTPDGRKALNFVFNSISYEELVFALKNVSINFISDIRKAVLYNEMIYHLEGYFVSEKNITLSEKATLYIKHANMVRDLETQFERDYKKVFDYIESVIKNYFLYEVGEKWEFNFKEQRGYHQIYKPDWKAKGLDIHFEIKLTSDSLINHKIAFLLDIEGSNKRSFKDFHEERIKEKLKNVMNKNQILYRKGKRADTFAIKEYYFITPENLNDGTTLNDNIIKMIEDFKDFVEVIDQEVNHFHAANEK